MIIWAILIFWASGVRPDNNGETLSLQTFQLGDDVTIKCFSAEEHFGKTMAWYKQRTGQVPCPIAISYNYVKNIQFENEFKDGRFNVLAREDTFHLNITATTREDIGKYYCGTVVLNKMEFISGAYLMLKGCEYKDINMGCDEREVMNGTTFKNTDSNNQTAWDPVLLCLISINVVLVMLIIALLVNYFKRWRKGQKGFQNETPSCQIENSDVNYAAVSFASARPARRSNNKLTEYSEVNYRQRDHLP
ncbi:uncharacterized protein LOC122348280 [Puntigrus tetrazona]|uniref:uncharacterized protein LOC122348280 n=1 Tax=Puntigrus tetrazona TaxID=1606681 RepID=UPI001C8B038D|nr:uncharacterized protein LOC122348280 [Puntigrus tetrazona]